MHGRASADDASNHVGHQLEQSDGQGARLVIGDGHALMADGEPTGAGIETSMDVEFTVDLIKNKAIAWPRMESQTHLIVLGSALAWALTRPEDQKSDATSTTSTTADPSVPPTLPPPKFYKVIDGVNMRNAPTTSSPVVGRVESGKQVLVMCRTEGQSVTSSEGSSSIWLRVIVALQQGYVSALYVETGDDIDDLGTIGICGAA